MAVSLRQVRTASGMTPYAGIIGPILFTTGVLAQDFFCGNYDPVTQQISDLEAGPYGWVQQINFAVFGQLVIVFAVGLHRGVRASGIAGPAILAWSGVGLVIAAIFPMRVDVSGRVYDPTGVHHVNGAIFFWSIGIGLVVLSRRLVRDTRWRDLAPYVRSTGVVLLVMAAITGPLARLGAVDLDSWAGIAQRAILVAWLPCIVILALRLRQLTHAADPSPEEQRTNTDASYAAMPRWAKVFGAFLLALILTFLVTLITRGPHRPGMPGMNHGAGTTPISSIATDRS
jgi:hypothetical membrane protein